MRIHNIIIAVCLFSSSVFAQEEGSGQKIFHALGYAAYTEVACSPIKVDTWWDANAWTGTYDSFGNPIYGGYQTSVYQDAGFSYFSMYYRFRYNAHEMNDNLSFGISATPDLGLSVGEYGLGYFNLPFQAELAFGAGSTYNSSSDKGGYIGLGIEMNKLSIIDLSGPTSGSSQVSKPKNFWIQPVVSTGVRYWNRKNKMKEVNLKFGFGAKSDKLPSGYSGSQSSYSRYPVLTLRLSWVSFLNY